MSKDIERGLKILLLYCRLSEEESPEKDLIEVFAKALLDKKISKKEYNMITEKLKKCIYKD